jgi:hypothetical protein
MVFGRKGVGDRGDALIAQGLAMMIDSYEDLERRLTKLSLPSASFDRDLWPPKGVDHQLMMIRETLPVLRDMASKHADGQIEPQHIGDLIQKAAVIGNTAQEFIEQSVHQAVAQHAIRKADSDARNQ